MTPDQRLTLILSTIAIIGLPSLGFIIRTAISWAHVSDKLDMIQKELEDNVKDKDNTHNRLEQQMKENKAAADSRIHWLEDNLWKVFHDRGN